MFDRLERPLKIICLAMALLLAWQLGDWLFRGDPLAHLKIPALPTLPGATNQTDKLAPKDTNVALLKTNGTNGTNATVATNATAGSNAATVTNLVKATNLIAKATNAPAAGDTGQTNSSSSPGRAGLRGAGPPGALPGLPPGMTPEMMARMTGGGPPGEGGGGGMKKIELPHETQARVDAIINSEVFGAIMRVPMTLNGIAAQVAFIQATNGQIASGKVGDTVGGVKLLNIGVNRVLIEEDGEKKELTLFNGIGGESLMPKPTNSPSTNSASTNSPSTNAPPKTASARNAAGNNASTNQTLSSK